MGEIWNAYRNLVSKPEAKRSKRKHVYGNIEMGLKRIIFWECGLNFQLVVHSVKWQVAAKTNQPSGSIKWGKCLDSWMKNGLSRTTLLYGVRYQQNLCWNLNDKMRFPLEDDNNRIRKPLVALIYPVRPYRVISMSRLCSHNWGRRLTLQMFSKVKQSGLLQTVDTHFQYHSTVPQATPSSCTLLKGRWYSN